MHYPFRVYRQFGRLQGIPPLYSTNAQLHGYDANMFILLKCLISNAIWQCRIDRRLRTTQKDWAVTHEPHLLNWYNRHPRHLNELPQHHPARWMEYLQWLQRSTRTHLMVPYTNMPADAAGEDDIADAFDDAQRVQTQLLRAPLNRYVVSTLHLHPQAR
jgi:hypothetical protein